MILAKIESLDRDAISYDEDLKREYSKAIQDVLSGAIKYDEFLERTEIIQATFRQRAMKSIEMKYQESGFGY